MTYIIDIAHPNALDDRRVVDEITDTSELVHALASPVFSWSPYDVVRVMENGRVLYAGFFTESECIDIGPESNIVRMLPDLPALKLDLVNFWMTERNPFELLYRLRKVISQKKLKQVTIQCLKLSVNLSNYQSQFKRDIEDIENNTHPEQSINIRMRSLQKINVDANNEIYVIAAAIRNVIRSDSASVALSVSYAIDAITESQQIPEQEAFGVMMTEVKKNLLFSDVLSGVENK